MKDSLVILESVNNFYSQSFGQLINITIAVLAFAGIVLPILITLYQKRLFKLEHKAIENSLTTEMEQRLNQSIEKIKSEYEKKESELEVKISNMGTLLKKDLDNARGGISHVQGNNEIKQGQAILAFGSFISASYSYVKSGDNLNLRRVLGLIIDRCLPTFNSSTIEEHGDSFNQFENLIEKVREYENDGTFFDLIKTLDKSYALAKKRQPIEPDL